MVHETNSNLHHAPVRSNLENDNELQFRFYDVYFPDLAPLVRLKLYPGGLLAIKIDENAWSEPHGYWSRIFNTTYDLEWHWQGNLQRDRFQLIAHSNVYKSTSSLHRYLLLPWIESTVPGPTFMH
jgi:hypothetical protein